MGLTTACKTCSLHPLCLPLSLDDNEIDKLDNIIRRGRPIRKGEHLFHQGDKFSAVYAVRTGTLKTYTLTSDGEEQITGFHLASEIIGLNAYDLDEYPASAKALETTNVCEIPIDRLDELSGDLPELRRQLMRMMGKELRADERMMLLLSKKTAEERLSSFLLSLSQRFARRGFSGTTFRLTMSRADMANYLGLAVETVSRVFTRFQKQGLIDLLGNAKEINITDMDGLTKAAALTAGERTEMLICACK
ncbi:fumarate/nitrate reduction transcriptional regulator Fnr [Salinibius halmophilus]|uniref:fumarate/nitrate reduction transcriptional regulator Fnr n=1 Tax=Salinibius halmophilus TaxID=1853216 RepID=UPI000E6707B3|nr:fumarate/nitrate reduction transcriptional regulator Fnr [Salinibius halmophilus]